MSFVFRFLFKWIVRIPSHFSETFLIYLFRKAAATISILNGWNAFKSQKLMAHRYNRKPLVLSAKNQTPFHRTMGWMAKLNVTIWTKCDFEIKWTNWMRLSLLCINNETAGCQNKNANSTNTFLAVCVCVCVSIGIVFLIWCNHAKAVHRSSFCCCCVVGSVVEAIHGIWLPLF